MSEPNAPGLDSAAKKTLPAKMNRQRIRAEKILVAKPRVVSHVEGLRLEGWAAPETEGIAANFDGPSQRDGKSGGQLAA
jgi:hypothetical protein